MSSSFVKRNAKLNNMFLVLWFLLVVPNLGQQAVFRNEALKILLFQHLSSPSTRFGIFFNWFDSSVFSFHNLI